MSERRHNIPLRPHVAVTETLYPLILKETCLHFDAWLYEDDVSFYARIELRRGGRDMLNAATYAINWASGALMYCTASMQFKHSVTLQDRALKPHVYKMLNAVHWAHIVPRANAPLPPGYKSRSVALHYIRSAIGPEPFDGATNWYVPPGT